jgi:KDO2-lipid IV(A) lauroyltransferase
MSPTPRKPPSAASLRNAAVRAYYACVRLLVRLPFRWQLAIGRAIGRFAGAVVRRRRHIVRRNLEICFPELTPAARERLMRQHFEALGAGLAEQAMAWFGPRQFLLERVQITGREHLEAGLRAGRGVILYAGHYTTLEFVFAALRTMCPYLCGMYKMQRNAAMNEIMRRGWGRNADEIFAKDDVRGMLRALKQNAVVWYAADQSAGGKHSALVPFFGEPAMTNTAICRIARISDAVVLPYYCRRFPGADPRYELGIGAPLENFPSADPRDDLTRLMTLMETHIRRCPEQYFWAHQRFKGRPPPFPDLYRAGPS